MTDTAETEAHQLLTHIASITDDAMRALAMMPNISAATTNDRLALAALREDVRKLHRLLAREGTA